MKALASTVVAGPTRRAIPGTNGAQHMKPIGVIAAESPIIAGE